MNLVLTGTITRIVDAFMGSTAQQVRDHYWTMKAAGDALGYNSEVTLDGVQHRVDEFNHRDVNIIVLEFYRRAS